MSRTDSERLQMVSDYLEHGDDCYAEAQYYSESKQCQTDLRRIASDIERKAPSDEEIETVLQSNLQNIPERFKIERQYYELGFMNCAKLLCDKMTVRK